jgi:hypothetical protein
MRARTLVTAELDALRGVALGRGGVCVEAEEMARPNALCHAAQTTGIACIHGVTSSG